MSKNSILIPPGQTYPPDEVIYAAQEMEANTGSRAYVVRSVATGEPCWEVTDRMPLLGTWFDSSGIRHG